MDLQNRVAADEKYAEGVRKRGLNNFFFFAKAICGFDRLTDRFHLDFCQVLQKSGHIRRLWLWPRDHYKSTIVSIAYPLWRLCRDPEETILIAADTSTNAEKKLRKIKSIILESAQIRAFFPEVIPPNTKKTTWSDAAITIPRKGHHAEPSISTVGAGGAVVGQHFTHIILDDIIAKEAAESPTVMESVIRWVDNVESLLVQPYENTIDVVGTRWHHNDIYSHIQNHWPEGNTKGIPNFYTSSELAFWDGPENFDNVLFPELYGGVDNAKNFAMRMARQNPYLWSCNYLNDPQVPEAEFNLMDLKYYTYDADEKNVMFETMSGGAPRVINLANLHIFLTCDPAYSKKKTASFGAITVSGCFPSGEIFLLEAKKGRWGGQGLIKELLATCMKYRAYLKAIGIEATGTQQAFIDDFRKEARRHQIYTVVDSLTPGGMKSKEARIRFNLQKYIAEKRLYIRPEHKDLQAELRQFPLSEEKDLLDSLAYSAEHYWGRSFAMIDLDADNARWEERRKTSSPVTGY